MTTETRPAAATQAPDLDAVKAKQQQMWASGDFDRVAAHITMVGELLCEAVDLHPGKKVLDVATGSCNTALAAARRFCTVTGVDYVPALVERARTRAECERLDVDFRVGDAEALDFPDGSFDVVLSTFGVMFAPNQEKAAGELLRVCRPGGKIGLSNWTPDGFLGELFALNASYVTPPPGVKPATLWGTEQRLQELLGGGVSSLEVKRREWVFRYPSVEEWIEHWRRYFGPTYRAFAAQDDAGKEALARDMAELANRHNRSGDGSMVVPGYYLEVVATRA
ncbi:MAG TPA: methyltransferase domain-containing protein [Chloroflexia bacterium]|nr:methyltransferase domain-containing protein [Chloroflexia bacterium]